MQVITQSLMKEMRRYQKLIIESKNHRPNYAGIDVCGLQVEAKYVNNMEFPSSDVMKLGQWFEHECTGQTTKFGHTPEPVRLKPKKATKKQIEDKTIDTFEIDKVPHIQGELSKKYSDALTHVARFHDMIKEHDFEIVETGAVLRNNDLGIKGDIDIVVRKKSLGEDAPLIFIDTKFSGLLDNKWEDIGWADETLSYKHNIMIQAVHYKLLGLSEYGYIPDFYFWVYSNTNTVDCKNILVNVSKERFVQHAKDVFATRDEFVKARATGWIPNPSPKRCNNCPLKDDCKHYVDLPIVQIVDYGFEA